MRHFSVVVTTLLGLSAACYSTGDGTAPPPKSFYFPTGLAVSSGGHALYVANSDFDLQYNGGTLQSYDLYAIRREAALFADLAVQPVADVVRRVPPQEADLAAALEKTQGDCASPIEADGRRKGRLGEACAPPRDSTRFLRDAAIIGAFATDLQLSVDPPLRALVDGADGSADTCEGDPLPDAESGGVRAQVGTRDPMDLGSVKPASRKVRVFVPVRGDTSITWADTWRDDARDPSTRERAFGIQCGRSGDEKLFGDRTAEEREQLQRERCDVFHRAGSRETPDSKNTRGELLPGEPFGMAQSEDGRFIALTHQTEQRTSLFEAGDPDRVSPPDPPGLVHVATGISAGGNEIVAVPLDRTLRPTPRLEDALLCPGAQRPAFLQTTRVAAEISLLRVYSDRGLPDAATSTLSRPFIVREATYPVNTNAGGQDSRGIVIDPTPRIACKLAATTEAERASCAKRPSRVFLANRTPPSLIVGELGDSPAGTEEFDPTRLRLHTSVPLAAGPSRVYLAPILDGNRLLSLRVFVVCYDANLVFVFNPDTGTVENIVRVAPGPFAMAFDPFSLYEVAARRQLGVPVAASPGDPDALSPYRFAYVASFSRSYLQVIDLDVARTPTFETVVYTLGFETIPKGTK